MNNRNILFTGVYQVLDDYIFTKFAEAFNANEIICVGTNLENYQKDQKNITCITGCPKNTEVNEYQEFINEIIDQYGIDLIVPMIDSEVVFMSKYKDKINSNIFCSNYETVIQCIDKSKTHLILSEIAPEYFKFDNSRELKECISKLNHHEKLVVRPYLQVTGSGKGMKIISKHGPEPFNEILSYGGFELSYIDYVEKFEKLEVVKHYQKIPFIITEFLPGKEYSIYAVCNNGELLEACIHEKLQLEQGTTNSGMAKIIENATILNIVRVIVQKLDLHLIVNIQLKEDVNGNPKLIEINPRIAGSIMLSINGNYPLFRIASKVFQNENTERINTGDKKIGLTMKRTSCERFF